MTLITGKRYEMTDYLLAAVLDELKIATWLRTGGTANKPKSALRLLLGQSDESEGDTESYEDNNSFHEAWNNITGG